MKKLGLVAVLSSTCLVIACGESDSGNLSSDASAIPNTSTPESDLHSNQELAESVRALIIGQSGGRGLNAFILPASDEYDRIPHDPDNPLNDAKVELGKLLFHDTAFSLNGVSGDSGSWSCATCHHAAAGFKSGTRQGIGEGGMGFGATGSERILAAGFTAALDAPSDQRPDLQPFASPSILNSAYQDVMLWNGQFGNSSNGLINIGIELETLATAGTPKVANLRGLSGVETQALAGSDVHRLRFDSTSPLETNPEYRRLWDEAFGGVSIDRSADAALAIAAYERTVLSNEAPFQRWLRGDEMAISDMELRGARVFFGNGGCVDCHRGPGLGSEMHATADEMFFAIGFDDLDAGLQPINGSVAEADRLGRGGFTGNPSDNYQFKIPQLYNLSDANVFGHGASFSSVRQVIEYKNSGLAQNTAAAGSLDDRFRALELTETDMNALTAFVENALNDPNLDRYQPGTVPSGNCIVVDPRDGSAPGFCPSTPD